MQQQASKREVELELTLWRERAMAVKNAAQGLQTQAQLFQLQAKECQENVERLEAALRAIPAPAEVHPDAAAPQDTKAPARETAEA